MMMLLLFHAIHYLRYYVDFTYIIDAETLGKPPPPEILVQEENSAATSIVKGDDDAIVVLDD